jgi:GNAT superfamily N-acetyltransferase
MPAAFTIQPLSAADAPVVWEMLYHAIHVADGAEPPPRSILSEPTLAHYARDWGQRPGDLGFAAIAEVSGTPVGAAWVRLFSAADPGYGFVAADIPELSIALLPGYRGQGLGSRLLAALLAAAEAQFPAVSLSVSKGNAAQTLYARFGFSVIGEDAGGSLLMLRRSG